jgi:hypothetical protein
MYFQPMKIQDIQAIQSLLVTTQKNCHYNPTEVLMTLWFNISLYHFIKYNHQPIVIVSK